MIIAEHIEHDTERAAVNFTVVPQTSCVVNCAEFDDAHEAAEKVESLVNR